MAIHLRELQEEFEVGLKRLWASNTDSRNQFYLNNGIGLSENMDDQLVLLNQSEITFMMDAATEEIATTKGEETYALLPPCSNRPRRRRSPHSVRKGNNWQFPNSEKSSLVC